MPAISITNDQRERLRWVQSRLGEDLEYGHVRPRDALEYLRDRFDEADAEGATGTAGPEGSGGAGPTAGEPSGTGTPTTDPEPAAAATTTRGGASEFVVRNGIDVGDNGEGDDGEGDDEDGQASADTGSAPDEAPGSSPDASSSDSPEGDTVTDDADGGATLNSMMSLLDDHDGKWREAGGGEEKYEVDLPEGGTERARTKDDVRAVLFKHYR